MKQKFSEFFWHCITPINLGAADLYDCIKAFHNLEIQLCRRDALPDLRNQPGFIAVERFPFWPSKYDVAVVGDVRYMDLSS